MTTDVKLTSAEFLEIRKFSAFQDALEYWASSKEDPIPYTDWQKIYNQIRRLYVGVDPQVPRLKVHLVSAECSKAWREKMESLHGSEWRKRLARQEAMKTGVPPSSPEGPGDGGGSAVPAPPGTGVGRSAQAPSVPKVGVDAGQGAEIPFPSTIH